MDNGKTLYVRLASNVASFKGDMAVAATSVAAFGSKADAQMLRLQGYAKTNQRELRSLGNVAGVAGAAAALGIGLAVKKFADFDEQMSSVQAATHATTNEIAALRDAAITLGADTKFTAGEAAEGIEELAKAGVATTDVLNGGLKGALDLASAGQIEVGAAAEIAATAMTQFEISGENIPHLADLLAAGAGKAQGGVTELGSALAQAGLIASNMGLSIEDTTGSLAAFAAAGLIGSDAGTSFKTMIQRLQAPIGRGAKALEKYGVTAYDTEGKFLGITNVAGQLQDKLGGLTQETRDAALAQMFGSDAIRAATVLYKQGEEGIQGWIDKTNDSGYAAETARLKTDNLAGDVERLGGALDSLFIGMGAGADGPAREFLQTLEGLVDVINLVPGPVKSAAVAGLALTAVFGGTVFAATRLIGAVGATRRNMVLLQASTWRTVAAVSALNKVTMLRNAGKGAAMLGGLAVASGAAGDMFGYSNTAAFALMGTMAGPMGIATGAAAGFILDVASANNSLAESFEKAQSSATGASSFQGQIDGLRKMQKAADEMDFDLLSPTGMKEGLKAWVGMDSVFESQAKKIEKVTRATEEYQYGIQALEDQTVGARDGVNELFDPQRMQQFSDQAGPVLDELGLKLADVLAEGSDGENWSVAVAAINEWKAEADTAAGKAKVLAGSVAGLDDELLTSADSSGKLAAALDALFTPAMDYDKAVIAWHASLRDLRKELGSGTKSLDKQTEAGAENVEAVMSGVNSLTKHMAAAAAAGKSSEELARMMSDGRQSILDQAEAVGFNVDAVDALITKYGLTPELVETIIKAKDQASSVINDVGTKLRFLDGNEATVTIKTVRQTIIESFKVPTKNVKSRSVADMLSMDKQANGGFYPEHIPAAANGLYNEAHIQRAQAYRTIRYAEPETQGESFIPHAMSKRGKSTQILGKTAARFGYDLSPRGVESARGGKSVVINNGANAPMIGSLSLLANSRAEGQAAMGGVDYQMRKIMRGGRWATP